MVCATSVTTGWKYVAGSIDNCLLRYEGNMQNSLDDFIPVYV